MRLYIILLLVFCCFGKKHSLLSAQNPRYQVKFFLLEECKITQAYAPEISLLRDQYDSDSIEFQLFFPAPGSDSQSIDQFLIKYGMKNFNSVWDSLQTEANRWGIRLMPEVAVVDTKENKLIYRGRIDDRWASVGRKRAAPKKRELKICLESIKLNLTLRPQCTEAVGCYLTRL